MCQPVICEVCAVGEGRLPLDCATVCAAGKVTLMQGWEGVKWGTAVVSGQWLVVSGQWAGDRGGVGVDRRRDGGSSCVWAKCIRYVYDLGGGVFGCRFWAIGEVPGRRRAGFCPWRTALFLSESGFAGLRWIFGMSGDGAGDDGLIHGGQGELQLLLSAEGAEGRGELQLLCLNQDLRDCDGFLGWPAMGRAMLG